MRGFDYVAGVAVNLSITQWRLRAREVIGKGGFAREDRKLGETFLHDSAGTLNAEIYGVDLHFKETKK